MQPHELIAHCKQQIDLCGVDAYIVLVLPRRYGKCDYVTLFEVRGEILQEIDGGIAAAFPAGKLINALEKKLMETDG